MLLIKKDNNNSNNNNNNAVFIDLSKVFYAIANRLIIAKVSANGFSAYLLKYILSYLKNKKQRTIIQNSCSSWEEIIGGVP